MEGAGWTEWVKNPIGHLKEAFRGKRSDYSPAQRDLLQRVGGLNIDRIIIFRQPLHGLLNKVANFATGGLWDKARAKHGVSDFFHLGLVLVLEDNSLLCVEKTQVVSISPTWSSDELTQVQPVPMHGPITVSGLLNAAINRMGGDFWTYSAASNNCQNFVLSILQAAGLDSPEMHSFVFQPVQQMMEDVPSWLPKLAQGATDLAGRIDIAANGRGFSQKKIGGKV